MLISRFHLLRIDLGRQDDRAAHLGDGALDALVPQVDGILAVARVRLASDADGDGVVDHAHLHMLGPHTRERCFDDVLIGRIDDIDRNRPPEVHQPLRGQRPIVEQVRYSFA